MFMRIFTIILIATVALLGVGFALLNSDMVVVKYYFGELTSPLSMVLVITFLIGIIIGIICNLCFLLKLKFTNRALVKQNKKLEDELSHIRLSSFTTDVTDSSSSSDITSDT